MAIRRLVSEMELVQFQRAYEEYAHVKFPMEYLKKCEVMGYFCEEIPGYLASGEMVGGFLVAPGLEMRWPKCYDQEIKFMTSRKTADFIELNGVWLHPKLRRRYDSISFWSEIAVLMSWRPEKYITYAVDVRKIGLKRLYALVISGTVHSGPTNFPAVPFATIYYSRPYRFTFFRVIYFAEWILRFAKTPWKDKRKIGRDGIVPVTIGFGAMVCSMIAVHFVCSQIALDLPIPLHAFRWSFAGLFGGIIVGRSSSLANGVVYSGISSILVIALACSIYGRENSNWIIGALNCNSLWWGSAVAIFLCAVIGGSMGSQRSSLAESRISKIEEKKAA